MPIASRKTAETLSIYIDKKTKDLIRIEAAHAGITMSEFARELLGKSAKWAREDRLARAEKMKERRRVKR